MVSPERLSLSKEQEKRPSRAVIIASYDFDLIGGGQESTRRLAQGWKTERIETCLVSPFSPKDSWPFAKVITLPTTNFPLSYHKIPLSFYRINKILKDLKPTSILLTHPGLFSSVLFLGMEKKWQKRTSAIWRGIVSPPLSFNKKTPRKNQIALKIKVKKILRPLFYRGLLVFLQRQVASGVRTNIAVSEAVASSLVKMGVEGRKIVVCPTQVGGEFTPELRMRYGEDWRRRFLKPDELGILLVGRVTPDKGHDWAFSVYRHLREQRRFLSPESYFKQIRITLVGGARNKQYLTNLREQKVRIEKETKDFYAAESVRFDFWGSAERKELQKLYNAYDLLLHSSPREGMPRVVIEALQAGMPVIGRSECLAAGEILKGPPYAVGFSVSTPEEASQTILKVMTSPDGILPDLRENALRWGSCFSAEKSALRVLELITPGLPNFSPAREALAR